MAYSLSSLYLSTFCFTFFCSIQILVHSFSVDLIHRDSPQSPFYNPSLTHYDRLKDAIHRSISRASDIHRKSTNSVDDIQSQILPSGGAFVMKLSVGTPPVPIFAIADTGSDITWTQCKPCPNCFRQVAPLFDPDSSSTFKKVSCSAQACTLLTSFSGCSSGTCKYRITYGDRSFSMGDLASDTFTLSSTLGKTVAIPNVFFGCGHLNSGTFNETSTGIIGLGGGAISFVKQLSGRIGGKFSYCLAPFTSDPNVSGKINFGDSAVVSGTGVVSTPLLKKSSDPFYYLSLENILVGKKSFKYTSVRRSYNGIGNEGGDIIIDSGTTLTLLPIDLTQNLEDELKKAIGKAPALNPPAPFSLCYNVKDNIKVPVITFKFTGAALELLGDSTFIQYNDELICLSIVASVDIAIYGNIAQANFLVGYDLVKNMISFKPTNCAKN